MSIYFESTLLNTRLLNMQSEMHFASVSITSTNFPGCPWLALRSFSILFALLNFVALLV